LKDGGDLSMKEKIVHIVFLIRCFQSLENAMINKQLLRLVSLPLWFNLNEKKLEQELDKTSDDVQGLWEHLQEQVEKGARGVGPESVEASFMPGLLQDFFSVLEGIEPDSKPSKDTLLYIERFTELLVDLFSQLPTRRFFHALCEDWMVLVRCQSSALAQMPEGRLFTQLLDMLRFYLGFEINNHTGQPLTEDDLLTEHYSRLTRLQLIAFKHFLPKLKTLALTNVASVETKDALLRYLKPLKAEELTKLCAMLGLCHEGREYDRQMLVEVVVLALEKRTSQIEALNEMPLYPTESILWDENIVPTAKFSGTNVFALPKLNLQFLTTHDYLLKNFNLFRLEATYEVREDMEDCIRRMAPRVEADGSIVNTGWSRMGLSVDGFTLRGVGKPNLGETRPSEVQAEVMIDLKNLRGAIFDEWNSIRTHDVLFLISLVPPMTTNQEADKKKAFPQQYGIKYIRGVEVIETVDEEGHTFTGMGETADKRLTGHKRVLRVLLDSAQYQVDTTTGIGDDVYRGFNIIMRRNPKENNFKAVLECIRDLMSTKAVIPEWLLDVFLGYGDPSAAQYKNLPKHMREYEIDYRDTFLSWDHLASCFPNRKLECAVSEEQRVPPFKVQFPEDDKEDSPLVVLPYRAPYHGPYPQDLPNYNKTPFVPKQIQAITSGVQPGLTTIVGPPGTGKTDVAAQIIVNLYNNFPEQRTLIVTHSNEALNDLFSKIMERDINEIHLLRLGRGEMDIQSESDWSKFGRVNFMLQRRLEHLATVEKLAKSLEISDEVSYTCETAERFFLFHIMKRWEVFQEKLAEEKKASEPAEDRVKLHFPFNKFFEDAPQPIFSGEDAKEDMRKAEGCFTHIKKVFAELEETRAFELLRTGFDRGNYLSMRQAKVIAMTCTHAALKRHELVKQDFQYDNIVMEETAQILEVETFIPMLLQNPDPTTGKSRLKRVILVGDHHQLPPVVQNMVFSKYSHLDQSLFLRFVRLGIPTIDLNMQGRMRPSLASLWSWRYKELGNMEHVTSEESYNGCFVSANPGMGHPCQLVDVPDYQGRGESEPNPYFYQNLGEAEYCVALFQYLRLLGYPAEKISILTTYNGQMHLIRDVVQQRCAHNPMFGQPGKVATVDKFQGQQNDIIILSLVRTKTVGHLRDVRRLIVAVSRARLGLYIFGRVSLFENCFELKPVFDQLLKKPTKLQVLPQEANGTDRGPDEVGMCYDVEGLEHMGALVHQLMRQRGAFNPGEWGAEQEGEEGESEEAATEEEQPSEEEAPAEEEADATPMETDD
jgi:intron-binding protein aquarius